MVGVTLTDQCFALFDFISYWIVSEKQYWNTLIFEENIYRIPIARLHNAMQMSKYLLEYPMVVYITTHCLAMSAVSVYNR
ncbi:unnamed protein product [Heterobilharzia americana]|nr:unnamed protein product [Heterobilharzia americana]